MTVHLQRENQSPEECIASLKELYSKYLFVESQLHQKKSNLDLLKPELAKSIQSIEFLQQRNEDQPSGGDLHVQVMDSLYTSATLPPKSSTVGVWLGANVMVEYSLDEAFALLKEKHSTVDEGIKKLFSEIAFVREQVTTIEVGIARVHNWGVSKRKSEAENK